jgi:hypothetical protein
MKAFGQKIPAPQVAEAFRQSEHKLPGSIPNIHPIEVILAKAKLSDGTILPPGATFPSLNILRSSALTTIPFA